MNVPFTNGRAVPGTDPYSSFAARICGQSIAPMRQKLPSPALRAGEGSGVREIALATAASIADRRLTMHAPGFDDRLAIRDCRGSCPIKHKLAHFAADRPRPSGAYGIGCDRAA